MVNYKKILIPIFLIVLCSMVVSAGNFTASIMALKNTITSDEAAQFLLTVNNTGIKNVKLHIYTPEPAWSIETNPSKDKNAWESFQRRGTSTRLSLKPSSSLDSGLHGVPIVIKEDNDYKESVRVTAFVELAALNRTPGKYIPSIKVTIDAGNKINPTEIFLIRVILENQNLLDLNNVTVDLESELVDKEHATTLGKWGSDTAKRDIEFKVQLDPKMQPTSDILRVNVIVVEDGKEYVFEGVPRSYDVVAYGTLGEKIDTRKAFLLTSDSITLTNEGNTKQDTTYEKKTAFFKSMFTRTNPRARSEKRDDGRYLVWDLSLEVGQSQVVVATTSYRPPLYVLIAVIIILILYFTLRSPVMAHKSAEIIKKHHGGVDEMQVQIHVRARKDVHDVNITEKIPDMFDILREFKIGTLHPSKILTHEKKGTIAKWHIEKLEGSEERIITYNIKAKLMVVGGFTLPPALVKFKRKAHREYSAVRTNALKMM